MALPVVRKVLLDTNVLIDFLRAGLHTDWLLGRDEKIIRFVSAVVFLELRLGADSPRRNKENQRWGHSVGVRLEY